MTVIDQFPRQLDERDLDLLQRLLSDVTRFPTQFWVGLVSRLEVTDMNLPISSVMGLQRTIVALSGDSGTADLAARVTALEQKVAALQQNNITFFTATPGTIIDPLLGWTQIHFTAVGQSVGEVYFSVGQFAPLTGRLKCNRAGTYALTAGVAFSPAQQSQGERAIRIRCPEKPNFWSYSGGPSFHSQVIPFTVSCEIYLDVDDTIRLDGISDVLTSVDSAANAAWLSAVLIRG